MRTFHITHPDQTLRPALVHKIDQLNKPKRSLGVLEDLALQIGLIQQTLSPTLRHPCHLLLGADHGIEREGVSVSPRDVTWQQMVNFTRGGGGVNMFCRQHHFDLTIVDMGVDHDLSDCSAIVNAKVGWGTRDFLDGPAMTETQMEKCVEEGAALVDERYEQGCNVLCIGEMGIGNTSASSVWLSLLGGMPLHDCVGAGAGLDADGVTHKERVLAEAVARFKASHARADAALVMRYFGGFEMVAAVGAMLRAAELHMVVLVDGFIMSACMLAASRLHPAVLDYAVFGHEGDEHAHRKMLALMHARPILRLGLRLGEGTGALCAYPIVESAVRMINEMNNFENAHITPYF